MFTVSKTGENVSDQDVWNLILFRMAMIDVARELNIWETQVFDACVRVVRKNAAERSR